MMIFGLTLRNVAGLRGLHRLLWAALVLLAAAPALALGGNFVVNENATDLVDATPGDGTCADINGKCSLRAAILEGNALAGASALAPHSITFSVTSVTVVNGSLPTMMAPFAVTGVLVTINGNNQGCFSLVDSGTMALGYDKGADGSKIIGLSIVNCNGNAIDANGHGFTFTGNFIGVDPTGLVAMPNSGDGISLSSSRTYGNFVDTAALDSLFQSFPAFPVSGNDVNSFAQQLATVLATLDPTTISGNVISSNGGDGIELFSENLGGVFVSGNMIGTDITGNVAMGNTGVGVRLSGFTFGNMIGPDNVIGGNTVGVQVDSPKVYLPNFIMANRIGVPLAVDGAHVGNLESGIYADTRPDDSLTNKNPTGLSLLVGPGNIISDNQGAPNSTDPDVLTSDGAGVYITGASSSIKVIGNTIGMAEIPAATPLQTRAYGNVGDGIIVTASGNTVQDNVIAGNGRHGILVQGSATTSTHLRGNTIGLYPAFASDLTLGNGFDGVHIDSASSTDVGGPGGSDANTIAGNGRNGIALRHGGATNGWSNLIQRNLIYANAQGNANALPLPLPAGAAVGIDLDHANNAADGVHDEFPANYANLDQAPPVICSGAGGEPAECAGYTAAGAASGTTTLDWTLKTHGPADFRAEFFAIDSSDDNTATTMTFIGEQAFSTDVAGLPTGGACSGGRCTSTLMMDASGQHVLMTVTDITELTDQPGMTGDWKNNLTCFIGDLGIILSACTVNDTSEFSNAANVPLSSNAALSNLAISDGMLTPAFASNTLLYTDAVDNATTSVTVTPTTADTSATVMVNGNAVTSGSPSGAISLNVGANPIDVVVTAQDGTTMQTYTITVNRAGLASNDADLGALAISAGSLAPAFAANQLAYTDSVSNATTSVTVTPTTADANATVTVDGNTVASGMASGAISLNVGDNMISVVVTAQDATTMKTYTITVNRAGAASNNASLSSLAISAGTLTPAFASDTLDYTDAVTNATTSVTLTPTTADANATVTVDGNTVASGQPSGAISLNVGANPVSVVVTAQDGTTTQTYTVTVNRAGAASNDASLAALTISAGTLTPAFAGNTLDYTDAVSNATTAVTVTPTTTDANATITVNGSTVASGMASGAISLNVGANMVSIVVTAQDATTTQTYTITVNRAGAASNDATLSALAVSAGTLTPAFAANTLDYTDAVSNATTALTVTPTTTDANATITVNGNAVASGMASGAISLDVGATPISVVVTAEDGTTMQTYTVTVNRAGAASNDASLSALAISAGTLAPAFAANTLAYTASVANATTSLTVTPTTTDANAAVAVNGITVASGSPSGAIALAVGANTISVVVTAQDATTTRSYTITVTRAASAEASLSGLALSAGTLTPAFAANTLAYTAAVGNATSSLTLTPTATDANATITVDGTAVSSGVASGAISLAVGDTVISVVVTAQDGSTTQTYTVTVTRAAAASSDASLSNLAIASGTLTPAFAANTLAYTAAVANATTSTTVTPTTADANATVTVNGSAVASGSPSGAISLAVGANPIAVVVTAQDGTTMQTYTITVTRAAAAMTMVSGTSFTGTGTITATISGGGAGCGFDTFAFVGPPAPAPSGVSFPDGLFQFTAGGCSGTVTVTATFPTAFQAGEQYWKYGATPGPVPAHWYALGAGNNVVLAGNTATFTIADGGLGDDDLAINMQIVDAGGPGFVAQAGGGQVTPLPTLSDIGRALLVLLLAALGLVAGAPRLHARRG